MEAIASTQPLYHYDMGRMDGFYGHRSHLLALHSGNCSGKVCKPSPTGRLALLTRARYSFWVFFSLRKDIPLFRLPILC